jgi:hypothetical protein
MLAITAITSPPPLVPDVGQSRASMSTELDRAERGGTSENGEVEDSNGENHSAVYEPIVLDVGVVETIRSLWDSETPLVRRFR